jgi:hypothetical protein
MPAPNGCLAAAAPTECAASCAHAFMGVGPGGLVVCACTDSPPAAAAPKAAPVAVPTAAPVLRSGGSCTSAVLALFCVCCWLAGSDMLSVCWRW